MALDDNQKNISTSTSSTLITGGAGFLGSHMCERLIVEGHKVICLDNLLTGKMSNITHLLESPNFIFIHHDVTQPIDLEKLLASVNSPSYDFIPQYVLHFASPASPKDYMMYPIHTLKVGALGTHNSLGLSNRAVALLFTLLYFLRLK